MVRDRRERIGMTLVISLPGTTEQKSLRFFLIFWLWKRNGYRNVRGESGLRGEEGLDFNMLTQITGFSENILRQGGCPSALQSGVESRPLTHQLCDLGQDTDALGESLHPCWEEQMTTWTTVRDKRQGDKRRTPSQAFRNAL